MSLIFPFQYSPGEFNMGFLSCWDLEVTHLLFQPHSPNHIYGMLHCNCRVYIWVSVDFILAFACFCELKIQVDSFLNVFHSLSHGSCEHRLLHPWITSLFSHQKPGELSASFSLSFLGHQFPHYSHCRNRNPGHCFLAGELLHLCNQMLPQLAPDWSAETIFFLKEPAPGRPFNGVLPSNRESRPGRVSHQINPNIPVQERRWQRVWRKKPLRVCGLLEWVSRRREAKNHTKLQSHISYRLHRRVASKQC